MVCGGGVERFLGDGRLVLACGSIRRLYHLAIPTDPSRLNRYASPTGPIITPAGTVSSLTPTCLSET